jgi:hypothetical protein
MLHLKLDTTILKKYRQGRYHMPERSILFQEACAYEYINRTFRDVADQDYIAARIVHRYGCLDIQFLWLAEQAVEKYLKAILLYNRKEINHNHDLYETLNRIHKIEDIPFEFPKDVRNFITFLCQNGPNRYFERSYSLLGEECMQLDRAIWFIRRYCYNMRHVGARLDGIHEENLANEIKKVHHKYTMENPQKYRLFGGFLEKVLDAKKSPLRRELVWKNFYYGSYKKQSRRYTITRTSANAYYLLHPKEICAELGQCNCLPKKFTNITQGKK